MHPVCFQTVDHADNGAVFLQLGSLALGDVLRAHHDERDGIVRARAARVQQLVGQDSGAQVVAVVFIVDGFAFGVRLFLVRVGVCRQEGCEGHFRRLNAVLAVTAMTTGRIRYQRVPVRRFDGDRD